MSLESSDKELTIPLERLSITNEMTTPINIFDAIDSMRFKKKGLILSQYLIISKRRELRKLIRTVQRKLFQS